MFFADQQIGLMLNRDLQLSYRDFGQGLLSSCDQNPKLADIPIQVNFNFHKTSNNNFIIKLVNNLFDFFLFSLKNQYMVVATLVLQIS